MGQPSQFGAPLGEYRGGVARVVYGVVALLFLGFGALVIVGGAGSADTGTMVALYIVGAVLVVLGAFAGWRMISSLGMAVQLFEGGFNVTRGSRTTSAAWGDVSSITQAIIQQRYYGIPVWTSYTYNLTLNNGEKLRFTEMIGKVRQMGETMQRQITHALTPRALEALRTGASLPFGKFSVNPMGVSNGAETLPWNQISNVTTAAGWINIGKVGKKLRWGATPVSKTPNAYIFLSLVDIMRRNAGQIPNTGQAPSGY
jgi:uncharacterized protein DUF6585